MDSTPAYTPTHGYEYQPKLSRPSASSYAPADDSSYELEVPSPPPRPRKTYKRPAAYIEESADEETYSRPSSSRLPSKYLSAEPESDAYPGLDGSSGYQQELTDLAKGSSLPSYSGDALDEADYSSSLSSLGLQSYASPSLPQSELSYLMSKMPRGFSPVPAAASSYGVEMGAGSRLGSYPFGFPSRPARRPYAPSHYGTPSPYLKVSPNPFVFVGLCDEGVS